MSAGREREGVAVVVAGGGARGAYEAGALSVLLPALERAGTPPTMFVGTSAGAINAVGLASLMHLGAKAASSALLGLWRQVDFGAVVRLRPLSGGLLDPAPLTATLDRLVDWEQLHANIRPDLVSAVGLVATSCSTHGSTVFVEGLPARETKLPEPNLGRAIDYVATSLGTSHVLASSAIPVAFPATELARSATMADWYADGGIRLNTPIKPALDMSVKRVVVVATSPANHPIAPDQPQPRPGIVGGAAVLAYAVLDDRMVEDLRTLARRNEEDSSARPDGDGPSDLIPYLFAGPPPDDARPLGRLVTEVLASTARPRGARRGPLELLARRSIGRLLAADPNRGELASHLFFDPEFVDGAIRLGQRDARLSLDANGLPDWKEAPSEALCPPSLA